MRKLKQILLVLGCVSMLAVPALASAASTTQAVTQGYGTDSPLQQGMIVKLKDNDPTKVQPLTTNTIAQMQGVVVAANDATVTLSNDGNTGQVFVASFGHYDVLISNQNGPIKTGDYITISSLAGVGMKVGTSQAVVLGKAAAGFDGTSNVASTASIKQANGGQVSVSIGRIPVDIVVSHNPLQQVVGDGLPGFLRKAGQQIANKPVSSARIYAGLIVLLVTTAIAGGMLYSGVRGGLVAIGRNPLARQSIFSGVAQVVLSGVIVFIVGLFAVYLLLRL